MPASVDPALFKPHHWEFFARYVALHDAGEDPSAAYTALPPQERTEWKTLATNLRFIAAIEPPTRTTAGLAAALRGEVIVTEPPEVARYRKLLASRPAPEPQAQHHGRNGTTEAFREQILARLAAGASQRQVAREFGCSQKTVARIALSGSRRLQAPPVTEELTRFLRGFLDYFPVNLWTAEGVYERVADKTWFQEMAVGRQVAAMTRDEAIRWIWAGLDASGRPFDRKCSAFGEEAGEVAA